MSDHTPRLLAAGHVNWDVTMHVAALPDRDGEAEIERLTGSGGGSAANAAAGAAALGVSAELFGSVGRDEAGRMALRELDEAGVDTGAVLVKADGETAIKYVIADTEGSVMMLSRSGANEAYTAGDLEVARLAEADQLHLTGQDPATAGTLAEIGREAGTTVSVDPGRRVDTRDFTDALGHADLLFATDREAQAIAGRDGVSPSQPTETIVAVKHGDRGATVNTPAGSVSHPGFAIDVTDTAGAGDAFAAGFIAALHGVDGGIQGGGSGDRERSDCPEASDGERNAGSRRRGRGRLPPEPELYREPLAVANACGALAAMEAAARPSLSWKAIRELRESERNRDGG